MSLTYIGSNTKKVTYNGAEVKKIIYAGKAIYTSETVLKLAGIGSSAKVPDGCSTIFKVIGYEGNKAVKTWEQSISVKAGDTLSMKWQVTGQDVWEYSYGYLCINGRGYIQYYYSESMLDGSESSEDGWDLSSMEVFLR